MKLFNLVFAISGIGLSYIVHIGDFDNENNVTSYSLSSTKLFGGFNEDTRSYSSNIRFNLTNTSHVGNSMLAIYMYKDNESIAGHEIFYTSFTAKKGINSVNYTINFPNGFNYTNGMNFYFEVGTASGTNYGEYTCKIYPSPKEIVITENNKNNLRIEGYLAKIGDNKRYVERYNFSELSNYFTNDRYYRLLIDDFSFTNIGSDTKDINSATLEFSDSDNLFPFLPSVNNKKYIDLKIEYKQGIYHFSYSNKFYVNPETLQMSYEPRENFSLVEHFYLPRGKSEKFDGYIFTLNILNAGYTKTTLKYDISFNVGHSLIGDCINSDYCVIGGVRV